MWIVGLLRAGSLEVGEDCFDSSVLVDGAESEFGEDVSDVFADGGVAEDEPFGDRGVGVSVGHEGEDFPFAGGECVEGAGA